MRQAYTPTQQPNGGPCADFEPLESGAVQVSVDLTEQELQALELVRDGFGMTTTAEAAHMLLRRHVREGVNKLAARRSRLRIVPKGQP